MAAIILLKRTRGTSPPNVAPVGTGVSFGELIYTYDETNVGAGKSYKKLYIGHPSGPTFSPIPIGGEYYTSLFPENPVTFGTPEASKVLVLDSQARATKFDIAQNLTVGSGATVQGDLTVGGNFNVTGDITYDEANARNWNITGIATAYDLNVTNDADINLARVQTGVVTNFFGVNVTLDNAITSASGNFIEVNVSHATTTKNLTVTGIATIEDNIDFRTQLIKIGREAGEPETDGNDRQGIFIGNFSGQGVGQTSLTKRNIAIGNSSFQLGGQVQAESNIFLGAFAGQQAEGSYNIYIGDKAGQDLGSQNIISVGSTGTASGISFSDATSLNSPPYAYRVYGSTESGISTYVSDGDFAIALNNLTDLVTVNGAVTGGLSFNFATASEGFLQKLQGTQFTVKGTDNVGLLTAKHDAIYVSNDPTLGLTGSFGFIVVKAGILTTTGREDHERNIAIGQQALWGAGISTSQSDNIAIGAYTLYNVEGSDNIAIGASSGIDASGSNNISIGQSSGQTTSGDNNVIIGFQQEAAKTEGDNQLVIGSGGTKWISGNSDGWVGIGTTAPDALLAVNGDLTVSGVATIPQIDINDIGVEDIKVTAGLATDFAITNAKIYTGIITYQTGAAATITNADFADADIEYAKITAGVVTSYVGTYATITTFDTEIADLRDVKITAGIITDIVGTAATINTVDTNYFDGYFAKITAGVVTSMVGTYATISTVDINNLDAVDVKVTTGLVTSLVGTYVTFQDADFQDDVRVGGAMTVMGDLTVNGTTSFVQSTVVQITDKNIELGFSSTGSHADATADNGGIIVKGTTDKTFLYDQPREAWESNLKFTPVSDDTLDIGTTDREWRDIYIDGTAHLDAADILDAKITAGIITSQVGTYATINTVDIETLDARDVKITAGIITDIVGTAATITTIDVTEGDIVNAKITAGVVTSLVGTYATITTFDTETADLRDVKITAGIITDIVGTAATITTIDATEGDIVNAKITAGVVTSLVGTYATITTIDVENLDALNVNITGIAVTDIVGTAATITTIDVTEGDIVNAKITAGIITSQVGTYATITTVDIETLDARDVKITAGIITDIVGTAATIVNVDFTNADIEDAKITAGLATDFAITNLVTQVGIATSAFITSGFITSLYDSTGVVGLNTQHILSTDPAGTVTWREPAQIGIATINAKLDTWYVSTNGVDDGDASRGRTPERPYRTIAYALSQISNIGVNDVLNIAAGVYEETFPLTVPAGLTVKGAGLRATKIMPTTATRQKDCFLMNDRSVVEDVTIAGQYFDTAGNQGWAFRYAPGIAITSRSPYVQRVTVFNKGSNITASDPYGYGSADSPPSSYISGGGAFVDGSEVASGSLEAGFLFNECTFIVPGGKGLEMTNGARIEYLNCFSYFASEAIKGTSGTVGLSSAGETRLRLTGITTVGVGNTITVFDTDGTTGVATAVVASYDGTYLGVTGKQTGFEVLNARSAKAVTFNGNAQLDTAVKKFGSASLALDGTNDSISVPSSGDLGFGTNTDFTIEFWAYANTTGLSSATLFDLRTDGTDAEGISLAFRAAGEVDMRVGTTTAITGSGAGIATGVWKHYALAREGTNTRLFVDGTQRGIKTSDTTDYGASKGLVIGADFDGTSNSVTGWIDDFRVEYGVAKYTAAFTAPTAELTGDKDTALLLNFNGSNGISTTTDNVIRNQDIRITQSGGGIGTATKVILADYSEFGADMRSVGCAVEYGQKGVIADGDGVTLRLFALNFNHVGSGGDFSNDPNLAIQANEVTETNNGDVSFVSIDHKGDFRVGDAFYVDQESGTVAFSQQVTSLQALSSLQITDGTDASTITPTSGTFGNIQIAGNNIESTTGDINIDPAGAGDINITGDVNVLGILTATVIQLDAFQKGDTSIALDDSGSDGTIRFNTDAVEGMRLTNGQLLGIATAAPRARVDVLGSTLLEDLKITGVATFMSNLTVGAGLTVTDIASFEHIVGINTLRAAVGLVTNFTVGQVVGDGSATINSPIGINSTLTFPDNVLIKIGSDDDLTIQHADGEQFFNRGHTTIEHFNSEATFSRLRVRSNFLSIQTGLGASDVMTVDNETLKLIYGDRFANGDGARLILTAAGSEMLGIVTFSDNGIYKGQISIGSSIVATAGVVTANRLDVVDADIQDAKITAGLATDFAITTARIETGFTTNTTNTNLKVTGLSTFVGISTFESDVYIAGNLNIIGDVVYDEVNGRNLFISGVTTTNNLKVTGVSTISSITIGAGSSNTKINTLSGELVLDSAAGQVTVQDNLSVIGYGTFRDGLYYRSDQGGINGIGYSGPNGVGYFENDGRLVSSASTVGFLTTSNYVLTTNANGIPTWTDSIDGGFF
jgi:hypothetical protein